MINRKLLCAAPLSAALLAACGGDDSVTSAPTHLSAATPAAMTQTCDALAAKLAYANTSFTSVTTAAAGALTVAGKPVPEHCVIAGKMNERVSAVDGNTYAIGFEMRLPKAWNGRFFYQANGGLDGNVVTATGEIGGGPLTDALAMGFAVISSDSGHSAAQNPLFGVDPQARIDYGYGAVDALTPMAKQAIRIAYGKAPDRSYFGGCSNGGRHAMVTAVRNAADYDGIIAGDPGFHLPKAAIGEMYGAQQFAKIASATGANGLPDIRSGFNDAERRFVGAAILAKCDALDGAADGIVQDVAACQTHFSLDTDIPDCANGTRTGACLTPAQKTALANVFAGARNSAGAALYASFPYDPGVAGSGWAAWKQSNSIALDPAAMAFTFMTPPKPASTLANLAGFALGFDMDNDAPAIFATSGAYTQSAWSFMTPPDETNLGALKQRGAKLLVYHGTGDPVFSFNDTRDWYARLAQANGGDASDFARFYPVPAMNHCSGGPATDQFDMLTPLVAWVEQGQAPGAIVAAARDAANPVPNAEVPASWGTGRSRPLCPYPQVARYNGSGDLNSAASFSCR
ncbi:tannase/feruloyl esterase family alpha/beta hydrolase [Burkholderia multivorans]|uniref:tannase/feruloyl esterase family alpha/beta hydrolase n=1 Tax=Burkholderia multivorans TaxID=87883 RepID=UPI00027802A4|nr:tannase/feruloyl esterase family alpha/beta hydrolase [Burkholderia multivorans]EJO54253.1 chlorogenate esterase [Burkholderia multivorans CF2]MBU9470116.1 tannase/feruloyl esterase family alpha/beta hydrolase [Burkholderia multivorans]